MIGIIGFTNAKTTITIGDSYTTTIDMDGRLPTSGVVNYADGNTDPKQTFSWSFPVYWYDDNGSGSFIIGGDGGATMGDIIKMLIAMFF